MRFPEPLQVGCRERACIDWPIGFRTGAMKLMFFASMALVPLLQCVDLPGQSTPDPVSKSKILTKEQRQERLARAQKALAAWLDLDPRDRDQQKRDKVADKVMAAGIAGLDLLASRTKRVAHTEDPKLIAAVSSIIARLATLWIDKVEKGPTRYAGQYNALLRLQPTVGAFYMRLLLDTPQWFPDTRRWLVIPALRDLYPKGPDRETLEQVEIMAKNAEIEPEYLRVGLAYALAQWGRRDLIKVKIRALEKQAASENEELELLAKRDLAKIYYGIRDYAFGAVAYREFLELAERAEMVYPVNYYNAACCMCLSGDRRSALLYLEKCLAINDDSIVDSSMCVERDLFDTDPEIDLVRKDPRFIAMIEKAFGARKKEPSGKDKTPH
jgi:tetratricopeptide (TPR) repeat protein